MGPELPLPLPAGFASADAYVAALLQFGTTSRMLRTLCGGVHVLDFFLDAPAGEALDEMSDGGRVLGLLPVAWRAWVKHVDVEPAAVLDLLTRTDLAPFDDSTTTIASPKSTRSWAQGSSLSVPPPPPSLLAFVRKVRSLLLRRERPTEEREVEEPPRHVALGMSVKKKHEVRLFAAFVDRLAEDVGSTAAAGAITHIADFGSGQNYLGRMLASKPYERNIVGIEGRKNNIEGAKGIDVSAGLVRKQMVARNKKEWRRERERNMLLAQEFSERKRGQTCVTGVAAALREATTAPMEQMQGKDNAFDGFMPEGTPDFAPQTKEKSFNSIPDRPKKARHCLLEHGNGSIQYVQHRLEDGKLAHVIQQIEATSAERCPKDTRLLVVSLHSCGNLVHHGLRSLVLNPGVKAVAMIGCCYNLMTERLGPASYKLPQLRPSHSRVETMAAGFDPHGFPMSSRYATYPVPDTDDIGVRLNITARMMAVQAPQNWGPVDSEAFFTRHFLRALLQRIFLDRGVVGPPARNPTNEGNRVLDKGRTVSGLVSPAGGSSSCSISGGEPIVIGSLKKSCYADFVSYVRGALAKIEAGPEHRERAEQVRERMKGLTDVDIRRYEDAYAHRKKELAIVWSLMAFAAGIVEAMIVVDRWLWLTEQPEVERAWVEPVFDYALSPRNLVVVGVKK